MHNDMDKLNDIVKRLNQALLDYATAGVDVKIEVWTQPYSTGPQNRTRWMYLTYSVA